MADYDRISKTGRWKTTGVVVLGGAGVAIFLLRRPAPPGETAMKIVFRSTLLLAVIPRVRARDLSQGVACLRPTRAPRYSIARQP